MFKNKLASKLISFGTKMTDKVLFKNAVGEDSLYLFSYITINDFAT